MARDLALGVIPWLILLCLLMRKANRRRGAWWAILPVVIVQGVTFLAMMLPLGAGSSTLSMMGRVLVLVLLALAALLLVADGLGRMRWWKALLASACLSLLIGAIGIFSNFGFASEGLQISLSYMVLMGVALVVLSLAGWRSRRKWSGLRFTLWLIAASFVTPMIVMVVLFATIAVGNPQLRIQIWMMLISVSMSGLATGLVLNGLVLPFVAIGLRTRFYRGRLLSVFGVEPKPEPESESAVESEPPARYAGAVKVKTETED